LFLSGCKVGKRLNLEVTLCSIEEELLTGDTSFLNAGSASCVNPEESISALDENNQYLYDTFILQPWPVYTTSRTLHCRRLLFRSIIHIS